MIFFYQQMNDAWNYTRKIGKIFRVYEDAIWKNLLHWMSLKING